MAGMGVGTCGALDSIYLPTCLEVHYILIIYTAVCVCVLSHFSCVRLFATLWTLARRAPLSMGFSRQEYWSGLPCPPPGALPNAGIELASPASPALVGWFFTTGATWEAPI